MLKHQKRNVLGKLSISFAGALILGSTLVTPMTEAAEVPEPVMQNGEITHYIINDNVPYFTNDELLEVDPGYTLSDLDELGRVQVANATLSEDIMPAEERGSISHRTPTGWNQNASQDEVGQVVEGGWLYNRSHMIGHQLSGLNDEEENLITGTKFFNNYAMLPIENFVANYIEEENENVRFRVTPHFEGDNLLASGMFMEGLSLHDIGDEDPGVMFNIYVPNIQPGVTLNYADGSHSVGETNEVVIPTHPYAKNFDGVTASVEEDNVEATLPVEEDNNEAILPVEEDNVETTLPVEEDNVETTLPVDETVTESTDVTASEIDNNLNTIHDGSSTQIPVVDGDTNGLPKTGSSAPEIGLIASAMALIIGAGLALFKRRESNNN